MAVARREVLRRFELKELLELHCGQRSRMVRKGKVSDVTDET